MIRRDVANTKPLRWLMKRTNECDTKTHPPRRKYQAFTMADETLPNGRLLWPADVANTKPLRWLMKLYPFKHLIILHPPPSLREPSAAAGQGMPNNL